MTTANPWAALSVSPPPPPGVKPVAPAQSSLANVTGQLQLGIAQLGLPGSWWLYALGLFAVAAML